MFSKSFCLCTLFVVLNLQICAAERNRTIVRMGNNTVLDGFTVSGARDACVSGENVDFSVANCIVADGRDSGIRAVNGDVFLKWCDIKQNRWYAVYHEGEGFTLQVENCNVRKNQRYGIYCLDSILICRNSIVSESDLSQTGNAGVFMFNPPSPPLLQNVTVARNKAAGLLLMGSTLPELQNCIVYHNNNAGPQLAGFSADDAA